MVFNNQAFKDTNISKIKNIKENIEAINCVLDDCTVERIVLQRNTGFLANVSACAIQNSKLLKVDILYGGEIENCKVLNCKFDNVYIRRTDMEECSFENLELNEVRVGGFESIRNKFLDVKGINVDFSVVRFVDTLLSGMDINHFVYDKNNTIGGLFENINIENGYVSENQIDKTEFKNVVWKKTKFRKNFFQYIDFTSTEFVECEFDRCEFHNCFFTEEQKKQIGLEN